MRVLWPDLSDQILSKRRILCLARKIRERVEPFLNRFDISIQKRTDYSLKEFIRELIELQYTEMRQRERQDVHGMLGEIEGTFKKLANLFSLVANTYRNRYSRFLFLGDVDDAVLNEIKIPGKRHYNCLKASHHGTHFGKALQNISTEFLLISRSQREFPAINRIHKGYVLDRNYRMALSTEFLGHCYIC